MTTNEIKASPHISVAEFAKLINASTDAVASWVKRNKTDEQLFEKGIIIDKGNARYILTDLAHCYQKFGEKGFVSQKLDMAVGFFLAYKTDMDGNEDECEDAYRFCSSFCKHAALEGVEQVETGLSRIMGNLFSDRVKYYVNEIRAAMFVLTSIVIKETKDAVKREGAN